MIITNDDNDNDDADPIGMHVLLLSSPGEDNSLNNS